MTFQQLRSLTKSISFSLIICIASYVTYHWIGDQTTSELETYDLVIAVLSARQNIERREIIRNTWAKNLPGNVRLFFILGISDCSLHPEDRIDENGCEPMDINLNDIEKPDYYTTSSLAMKEYPVSQQIYGCFVFRVNYAIRILKLGILSSLFTLSDAIVVKLIQGTTREIIAKATIRLSDNTVNEKDGYVYVDVEEFVYPKGFEGMIQVNLEKLPKEIVNDTSWNDGGGIISFKAFCVESEPRHDYNFYKFSYSASAVSLQFIIHELPALRTQLHKINDRKIEWENFTASLSESIKQEQINRNDLFFTDSLDIYRFLPKKLLLFYNWLEQDSQLDYKYLLKTDDDAIVLVDKILFQLRFLPDTNIWWSKFRKNWAVNHFGKWTEQDYTSPTYPAFACGGGNILSRDLVNWISNNSKKLHSFQGEDVSAGIWLSAVNPQLIDDERWRCDDSCDYDSYNRVQLSKKQVLQHWATYLQCGSLCFCKES